MKSIVPLVMIGLLLAGCVEKRTDKTHKKDTTVKESMPSGKSAEEAANPPEDNIIFQGQGNEPFWNIRLSEKEILFTSLIEGYEEIHTPVPDIQRAADANVKRYHTETEKVILTLTIAQAACADTMSDKNYGYKVGIEIQLTGDKSTKLLQGCGDYLTDKRLHATWVLEQLGEAPIKEEWFNGKPPEFNLNTVDNNFSGYAGCNQMRGGIFWEPNLLRFTGIITTRKACTPENREDDFLKALQSATGYKVKNNRLWLSNPNEMLLVFKKID